jgi:hypothetical protein
MEPQNPSTGPRSEQGKAVASRNAIRHGLTSKHPWLLPNENPEAWRQLLDSYTACLRPANLIERDLTEQIAWARWQRDRLHSIFAALHALAILKDAGIDSEYLRQARALHANAGPEGAFGLLNRYLSRVNREYEKAYRLFEHVRANPIPQPSPDPDLPEPTIALPIELPPRPSAHDNPEWISLVELTENALKPFPEAFAAFLKAVSADLERERRERLTAPDCARSRTAA